MSLRRMLCDRSPEELEALLLQYARTNAPSAGVRRQAMARAAAIAAASAGVGTAAAVAAAPKILSGIAAKAAGTGVSAVAVAPKIVSGVAAKAVTSGASAILTGKLLMVSLVSGAMALGAVIAVGRLSVPADQGSSAVVSPRPPSAPNGNGKAQSRSDRQPRETPDLELLPAPASQPPETSPPLAFLPATGDGMGSRNDAREQTELGAAPDPVPPSATTQNLSSTGRAAGSRPAVAPARPAAAGNGKGGGNASHGTRPAPMASSSVHRDPPPDEAEAAQASSASSAPPPALSAGGDVHGTAKPTLARELGLLEQTRAAIARGAAGEALASLDRHRREFPEGGLVMESAALRIEALAALHRNEEAAAAARAFLNRYPDSPLADRVRSIGQRTSRPAWPSRSP